MDKPLNEVASTAGFLTQAKAEGMTEQELTALENALAANPTLGDLIPGAGGCRKVRFARKGGGKSGGYRVVTFFVHDGLPIYLLAALSKGSRENFTAAEVSAMAAAAKRIKEKARRRAS